MRHTQLFSADSPGAYFWNILDEKEFLDNSHHIGLDCPQGLNRHTFSQKSLFGAKTA